MKTINLANYAIRQPVQHKQVILDRLHEIGVHLDFPRAGLATLLEIEPILARAKTDNLRLTLPPVPRRYVHRRRFGGGEWVNAYTRYDAVNLASMAFSDYGMTAGLAGSVDARAMTQILESFKA